MNDPAIASSTHEISFGPFRLLPSRQLLLEADKPLRIGNRAFDVLTVLVEKAGEIVSNEELFARVWPNTFVEEVNLRVQVAAIRKALGDGRAGDRYVVNIPGRGYRFVAPISISQTPAHVALIVAVETSHNLPIPLTRIFGRAETINAVVALLQQRRFVTLVGPGGIGKTTVALAAAERLIASYADRVQFIDLAPLANPNLVPSALASVLGIGILSDNPVSGLISYLRDKQMLLVLDNCEHVVQAAAALTLELLKGAPGIHILATSREPLRAEGEHVKRLPPLDYPPVSAGLTAAEAMNFSAVQLFVERAAASSYEFDLSDETAPFVAEICRRLDGVALAVELAASRVDFFGVRDLASRLDDRFRLLEKGRRTALPRHQTLRATLDWSYELLSESERVILRRLAVLVGSFTLESASAIAADEDIPTLDVVDCVATLVAKSLISADVSDAIVRYRLFETMRAYALAKLTESGEANDVVRRHAEYFRDLFFQDPSGPHAEPTPTIERVDFYRREIDNVRAALDWAFSTSAAEGATIGIALTAAYAPVWLHLSFIGECRERLERALVRLKPDMALSARSLLQIHVALGLALVYSTGPSEKAKMFLSKALEISETLDDVDSRLQALWAMLIYRFNNGELLPALTLGETFLETARQAGGSFDIGGGHRLIGSVLHYAGNQKRARDHLERAVQLNTQPGAGRHVLWSHYDQHVIALSRLARVLWLQGFADLATKVARTALTEAQGRDHKLSICFALGEAVCLIDMMRGDLGSAEQSLAMLIELATTHNFTFWKRVGGCLEGQLSIRRGKIEVGSSLLRSALNTLAITGLWLYFPGFVGDLAPVEPRIDGNALIDKALTRAKTDGVGWCVAELLRVKGELLLSPHTKGDSVSVAEACFFESLDVARQQGALFWELRTALSFARVRLGQDRPDEARQILAPVYDRFTEGFDTSDLRAAKTLLFIARREAYNPLTLRVVD